MEGVYEDRDDMDEAVYGDGGAGNFEENEDLNGNNRNPQLKDDDPTLFANLPHLRNDDPERKLYVGPTTGTKGFRRWFPAPWDGVQRNIALSYSDSCEGDQYPKVRWTAEEQNYNNVHKTIGLKYLMKFFPSTLWTSIVNGTNARLAFRKYKDFVTKTDIVVFLGLQLIRVLERSHGTFDDLFSPTIKGWGPIRGGDYTNRFGVEKNKFKRIMDNFRLRVPAADDNVDEENDLDYDLPVDETEAPENWVDDVRDVEAINSNGVDKWYQIREVVDEFNKTVPAAFLPGQFIVVDEMMSAWKGLSGEYRCDGAPHITKIKRKPEGIGTELKAASCGKSKITLQIEIMEGADAMKSKQYNKEYGAGCGVVLRLMSPWQYKNKVVIADSAFSSMVTLMALFCLFGTFFMGIVKTAHTHFPSDLFHEWYRETEASRNEGDSIRNRWTVLTTTFRDRINPRGNYAIDRDYKVMAICWADVQPKCIISNWGDTRRCSIDICRERSIIVRDARGKERQAYVTKTIAQPNVIHEFFKYFGTIDASDHNRQGTLAIERYWLTKRWWLRIFQTIFGIIVLNAYRAYCLEVKGNMPYLQFVSLLAAEMISYSECRTSRHSPREEVQDSLEVRCFVYYSF